MKRRHLLKAGLFQLLLTKLSLARAQAVRYVERDGWILRLDDD